MAGWIEVGKKAAALTLNNETGNRVRPSDLKGKPVVLDFYPRDDTPGCTKEGCSRRDRYDEIKKLKVHPFGLSTDSAESHAEQKINTSEK
jgi:peroxiredoxin Q/BCP